jgi:phage-related protein
MITLPSSIMQELHKIASDGAVIYLAEIPEHGIRLARNTEDVTWDSKTWSKFWFELDPLSESTSGEVPELTVKVSNIGGFIEQEVVSHDNFEDSTLVLYFVNANCLSETTPILSLTFDIMKVSCDKNLVTIKLSCQNPILLAYPPWKFHGSLCQYPSFPSDPRCGYVAGVYTTCSRTLADCILRGNQARFGAQLGLINEVISV